MNNVWGNTLFTTRYRDTGFTEGVRYSLVNNVWGYIIHGDTLFTVMPGPLSVCKTSPADSKVRKLCVISCVEKLFRSTPVAITL